MMTKKYSLIHLPLFAFFSKRLYREVGHKWKGVNFCYLFLLLAICLIPPAISMREHMLQSLELNQLHLINQIPEIQIRNGRVMVDQTKPVNLTLKNGSPIAIIATTGSMNYIDDDSVMALLTDEELIIRRGKDDFNTLDLSKVSEFYIDKHVVNKWLKNTRHAIAPLSYGIFLLLSYVFAVVSMLLVAIVGFILSSLLNASLKYSAIVRISVAAATPAIIIITTAAAFGLSIPAVVFAGLTLVYLIIGITACKKPMQEDEAPRLALADLLHDDVERESDSHPHAA